MFETLGERLAAALKKISGRGVLRAEDVDAGLREVRLALLEADVNFKVVKEFVDRVRPRLVGLQGSGKTTTAIKLALLARDEGHQPMVVALDLRRPAAVAQLKVLA